MITDPIKKEYEYTHIELSWECTETIEVGKILEALKEYSEVDLKKSDILCFGIKWDSIYVYTAQGEEHIVTFAQLGVLPQDNICWKDPDMFLRNCGGETSTSST